MLCIGCVRAFAAAKESIKKYYSPDLIEFRVAFWIDLRKFPGRSELSDIDIFTSILWDENTSCHKLPVTHTSSRFLQVLIRSWHEVRYVSLHAQNWLKRGSYRSNYHPCTLSQDKRLPGHLLDKAPWKFC